MSIQTISEIKVNSPEVTNLHISSQIKESSKNSSFSDLLTSYTKENSNADKIEEKSTSENTVKSENESSKEIKNEDKIAEKTEEKEVKNEKTETKADSKEVKEEVSKTDSKKDQKTAKKADLKKSLKEKSKEQTSEKEVSDYSQTEIAAEKSIKPEAALKNQVKTVENEDEVKADVEVSADISDVQSSEITFNFQETKNTENNGDDSEKDFQDFDFSDKKKSSDVTKFDKDGKIEVRDLRTKKVTESTEEKSDSKSKTEVRFTDEKTAEITMNLEENAQKNVLSLDGQSAAANGSDFQAMLNNQIQQNTPEFVKAGNIILKDNDKGTINLVLHPDDLGNVKIELSLDGKTVTGHISVASKEALEVFKENSQTLREAFIKEGFADANFDVSYNSSSNFAQSGNSDSQNDGRQLFGRMAYSSLSSAGAEEFAGNEKDLDAGYENYSINIVA